jgi:hypothetical protein
MKEQVRIWKKPGWFLRILDPRSKPLGASSPLVRVWMTGISLFVPELFLFTLNAFYPNLIFVITIVAWLIYCGILFALALTMHFLGVIIIRKECDDCQFRFHIIAHEKNHLKLNSLYDDMVERETWKQTGSSLLPLILSNPVLCKDCALGRKKYRVDLEKYIKAHALMTERPLERF